MNPQLAVIKGAMFTLSRGAAYGSLQSLNLLPEDLALVEQDMSWQNVERNQVTRTLDILMHGTTDALGLPRIEIPAEYIAAAIVMFVHPCNLLVACRWMEAGYSTVDALGNPTSATSNTSVVSSQQLFALVLQLANDVDLPSIRAQFEYRVKGAINKAIGVNQNANEPSQLRQKK